ncbi:MAG: hypothetical protein RIE59_09690 [Imperialibacter sp.]
MKIGAITFNQYSIDSVESKPPPRKGLSQSGRLVAFTNWRPPTPKQSLCYPGLSMLTQVSVRPNSHEAGAVRHR